MVRDRPEVVRALSRHDARLKFRPLRRYLIAASFIVVADLAASGAPHVVEIVGTIASRLGERSESASAAATPAPPASSPHAGRAKRHAVPERMPPEPAAELSFDPKAADHLPPPPYAAEERACLARAVYFEARGEAIEGQIAVAQVVLNRVAADAWPKTICGVVYQGVERAEKCQFSFACTDNRRSLDGAPGWEQAKWIADDVAAGRAYLAELEGVLHFHTTRVRPIWRLSMRPVRTIGNHIFYLDRTGGAPRAVTAAQQRAGPASSTSLRAAAQRRAGAGEPVSPRAVRSATKSADFVSDTMDRMRQGGN